MNKKLLPLLISPLLLCGCSIDEVFGTKPPDFDTAYSATAEISYGDLSATCDITRNSTDDWSFSFSQPDYLMGMELLLTNDGVTAKLGELSVTADENSVYQLIPDIVAESLDSLARVTQDNIIENEDGTLTVNTEIDGNKVIITADKNGKLIALKCPYHKLSVKFADQMDITPPSEIETLETEEVSIIFDDE